MKKTKLPPKTPRNIKADIAAEKNKNTTSGMRPGQPSVKRAIAIKGPTPPKVRKPAATVLKYKE